MAPRISVVIPTHNYAPFVGRAIDSALGQTLAPYEVIVVDDGSTDGTGVILAAYGDRIRVAAGRGAGVSAARNVGLALARGDLVAVLDADDEWRSTKLARQVPLLAEDPRVGVVGCANIVSEPGGRILRTRFFPNPSDERVARMRGIALREPWVGSSNSGALIHRRVLDTVGGYAEDLQAAEDWELWLRIADRFLVRNVHEVLATVWFHRTGRFRDPVLMRTAQEAALAKAVAAWPDVFDAALRRRLRALIEADVAGEHNREDDWFAAARCYARSLAAWPQQRAVWQALLRTGARAITRAPARGVRRSMRRAGAARATARAARDGTAHAGR